MARQDQDPQSGGNSLIASLIEDEMQLNPEAFETQDQIEASRFREASRFNNEEQVEVKPEEKIKPQVTEPVKEDQAPKKEYRFRGKSEKKEQPAPDEQKRNASEEESAEPSEPVMTAEFVRMNGLPKNMVGLPFSELGKSYRNLVGEYTRTRQKYADYERNVQPPAPEAQHQARQPEVADKPKSLKDKVVEKMSKLPDPLDNGFNQALANAFIEILQEDRDEQKTLILNDAMMRIQPQLKSAQEYARRSAERELMENITSSLPKGADVREVIQAFKDEYKDDLEDMLPLYEKKPQRFVRDIVNFFNLNYELHDSPEDNDNPDNEDIQLRINALAQKKAADALRETKKKKPSDLNSQNRKVTDKRSSLMQDLLDDEEKIYNQMNF